VLDSAFEEASRAALARVGAPALAVGVLAEGEVETLAIGCEPDARFRIASVTKPFTATLALALLDLDAPVGVWPDATVRHVLSHTSGYDCEFGDLSRFGDGDDALERAAAELPSVRRWLPAGEAWSYSNAGYWVAGLLCARRDGTTFEDALRRHVLEPARLDASGFGEPTLSGHDVDPATGAHSPTRVPAYPRARRPSGGLVSTVGDLLRFARRQLEERWTTTLRERIAPTPGGGAYGLGFGVERVGGVDVWGHPGSFGGFESSFLLLPERGAAFVGLTNSGAGARVLRDVEDEFFARLLGVRRTRPATVEHADGELDELAGTYAHAGLEATIARADGGLRVDAVEIDVRDGARIVYPPMRARPIGRRAFVFDEGPKEHSRFDFLPAAGRPRFARIGSRLAERVA
jgi:CubicO group peptidase (beta-lactamase class C family)